VVETRLRVALVGTGRRGAAHLATVRELSDLYDLVAVCDVDETRARAVAENYGVRAYGALGELLSNERLDAAVIVTPPESHHLVAKPVAECGVHMLIETPLALTRAMMDVIGEAAEKAGVQVEVGENYGRRPAERLNRQAIESGLIGTTVHASVFNAPANHDTCYHTVSLLRLYVGADVAEVEATAQRQELGAGASSPSETWTDAVLRFANGVTASVGYVSTWTSPLRWGRPRIASVEGTEGYLVTAEGAPTRLHRIENGLAKDYAIEVETRRDGDRDVAVRFTYPTQPAVEVANPFADRIRTDADPTSVADGLARAAELVSLHRAVTTGAAPECGIATARRSQEIGIAIAESALVGRALSATLGAETAWEREQHEALRRRWGADPLKDMDRLVRGASAGHGRVR